jgi:DNA-binding NtrC family response regulator
MRAISVVVLHQNIDIRKVWARRLDSAGFGAKEASSEIEALRSITAEGAVVVVSDLVSSETSAIQFIKRLAERRTDVAVVFVATTSSEDLAIKAFRAGASDYVQNPLDVEEIVASVTRIVARRRDDRERSSLKCGQEDALVPIRPEPITETAATRILIGGSAVIQQTKLRLLRVAAAPDTTVLITGETGTGKELAAEVIHNASPRNQKRLISLNCAAIPEALLESELFGYERGAFTGAQWATAGILERADGGTLFLDEVGELSPTAQAKVLRVIESREFSRLGSRDSVKANVRFLAATNRHLEELEKEGKFRADLRFRLNVVRISLPPLRERKEDLPLLIDHYLRRFNSQFGRKVLGLSRDSYDKLLAYDWPGNIRELKNVLEASFVDAGPCDDVLALARQFELALSTSSSPDERDHMLRVLLSTKWNKSEAARQLHWSRMTLYRKMLKYRILDNTSTGSSNAA